MAQGRFEGAAIDLTDGYIHFSTADQLAVTADLHFAGQTDLIVAAIRPSLLGEALKYEPSRGGQLFPHLYGHLPRSSVAWVSPLPLGDDGRHRFPDLQTGASA